MSSVRSCLLSVFVALVFVPVLAQADSWTLWDWDVYVDGVTNYNPTPPSSVDSSGFDFGNGLGSLVFSYTTPGSHTGGVYLYDFAGTGEDLSNAYGTASGATPAGVSWEMDWPGYLRPTAPPTVFDDFAANALTNTNGVLAYSAPPDACCSVAMAMIQHFALDPGWTATLSFNVSQVAPSSGFYLQETNYDSGQSIYLTESLVQSPPAPSGVPEPGTVILLVTMGAGAFCALRRRRA